MTAFQSKFKALCYICLKYARKTQSISSCIKLCIERDLLLWQLIVWYHIYLLMNISIWKQWYTVTLFWQSHPHPSLLTAIHMTWTYLYTAFIVLLQPFPTSTKGLQKILWFHLVTKCSCSPGVGCSNYVQTECSLGVVFICCYHLFNKNSSTITSEIYCYINSLPAAWKAN